MRVFDVPITEVVCTVLTRVVCSAMYLADELTRELCEGLATGAMATMVVTLLMYSGRVAPSTQNMVVPIEAPT